MKKESDMKKMTLGISSGSLQVATIDLLKKVGITISANGRNFTAKVDGSDLFDKAIIMRPNDLPRAVSMGVVDAALTGFDMLCESGMESEVCVITELQFAKKSRTSTQVVVFGRTDDTEEIVDDIDVSVSSEYMYLARTIFKNACIQFSTGSTEIKVAEKSFGFRYGVGVVESGKSLIDNDLKIIKTILISPVVLIAREDLQSVSFFGDVLYGALDAEKYQLVKFNADASARDALVKIVPAMESPTINILADGAIAFETVIPKELMTDTIIAIKSGGGRNILVQNMQITL